MRRRLILAILFPARLIGQVSGLTQCTKYDDPLDDPIGRHDYVVRNWVEVKSDAMSYWPFSKDVDISFEFQLQPPWDTVWIKCHKSWRLLNLWADTLTGACTSFVGETMGEVNATFQVNWPTSNEPGYRRLGIDMSWWCNNTKDVRPSDRPYVYLHLVLHNSEIRCQLPVASAYPLLMKQSSCKTRIL
jgi:hypothetical protein